MTDTKKPGAPDIADYKRRYRAKHKGEGRTPHGNPLIERLPRYPRTRKALLRKLSVVPSFGRGMPDRDSQTTATKQSQTRTGDL